MAPVMVKRMQAARHKMLAIQSGSGSSEAIASAWIYRNTINHSKRFCQTYGTESTWCEGNRNVIVTAAFMADTPAVPDSSKQLIDTLRRSKIISRITSSVFSEATGLALALGHWNTGSLAHHGKKHENPFCALLAERPATLAVCLQAHQDMIDHTGLTARTPSLVRSV